MDKQTAWTIYFAAIAGIQFHPRNMISQENALVVLYNAADTADTMLKLHGDRFPWETENNEDT